MNGLGGFMAGSIVAKLLLDKTGWNDSIKSVKKDQKDLDGGFKNLGVRLEALGARMTKFGASMTKAVTLPLAAIGAASVKMAMDAVESENLFEVSMGNMAEAARDWSKELSKSLGLNQYETRKTIGVFDVMLKSMGQGEQAAYDMAKGLTQLGYDMASFYNLRPDEAFEKLRAGISGEVEPLKRLGIIVNETTIKNWALTNGLIRQGQTLSESQKTWARYNVIMEQTKLAQGDLARTIDSPANKLRILKSRIQEVSIGIGMQLLPIVEKMMGYIQGAVRWFQGLSESTKDYIVKLGLLAAALGPVNLLLGTLLKNLRLIKALGPIGILITLDIIGLANAKAQIEGVNNAVNELAERTGEKPLTGFRKFWNSFRLFVQGADQARMELTAYNMALAQLPVLIESALPPAKDLSWAFGTLVTESFQSSEDRIKALGLALEALPAQLESIKGAWEENLAGLTGPELMEWTPGSLFADAIDTEAQMGSEILAGFVADSQAKLAEATAAAQSELARQQAIRNQIMADIASGFESIMDGSKTMGEIFSGVITKMIADMGKLVIAEIMMAKKSILASQMEAAAKYIASVFKAVPFPFNIALAAGGFAVVSKLFKALFKFDEGGYFKKKSIIPMAQVAENEPEFIAPESKLIEAVRTAMAMPMPVPAMIPAMAGARGGGGGAVNVYFSGPLIQTTGLSRRDLVAAGEQLRHIVDGQMRRVSRR